MKFSHTNLKLVIFIPKLFICGVDVLIKLKDTRNLMSRNKLLQKYMIMN